MTPKAQISLAFVLLLGVDKASGEEYFQISMLGSLGL